MSQSIGDCRVGRPDMTAAEVERRTAEAINDFLAVRELWAKSLREALFNELLAMKWVNILPVPVTASFIPTVSMPVAFAIGAAAAVIKNPVISRRFWSRS